MDIKDSYLHGTVGVVKSISVDADKLKYKLADIAGTVREVTLPIATQTANGLLSKEDKKKLDNMVATKVANDLILKINSGTTEGTSLYTYNGSAAKTLDIKSGTGIAFSKTAGALQIFNSGVRSIATGTTNGTISVNTNGTSANVAVKGLGSAAYTASDLYLKQATFVNTNTENVAYKKVTISKNATNGYGIWIHSRYLHYLLNSGLAGGSTVGNNLWELGTNFNNDAPSNTRRIHVKMVATSSSSTVTLYTAVEGYCYMQIVSSGTITISDSSLSEYESINSGTTGWVTCLTAKWTDTTYNVVSSSANGLAPKVINTNTTTIGSAYYILASTNGSATPSWYKLPATAFANDDTKVTLTNTTTSASYRVLFSGNANDTTETTTARKSANLLFNPSTGNLTATSLNLNGDIVINDGTNNNRYIKWLYANTDNYGWRIGYLGLQGGDNNDLTFDSHRKEAGWASALYFKHTTLDAHFAGIVIAPTFQGNLDGTYVNKLTGYSKAESAADLAATDTLNAALGKLEYKADTAYDWYKSVTGTDNDDIINKWEEIVDFIDSVKEGTDITEEFVTRKTDLTITGTKTFTSKIYILSTSDNKIILNNTQADESKILGISFQQDGVQYGALQTWGTNDILWNKNKIYHTGNLTNLSQLNNDLGFVTGGPYLPLSGGTMTGPITLTSGSSATFDKTALSFISKTGKEQARIGTNSENHFGIYSIGTIYLKPNSSFTANGPGVALSSTEFTYNNYKIWHEGNDGSESGLDADLLDGKHASEFALNTNLANYVQIVHLKETSDKLLSNRINCVGQSNKGDLSALTENPTGYGSYISIAYSGKGAASQLYLDTSSSNSGIYYRTRQAGTSTTYRDWRRVLDENNYGLYALPLAGGNMTGNINFPTGKGINTGANYGYTILAETSVGSNVAGASDIAASVFGTNNTPSIIRSSGDLYHYHNATKTRYRIWDEGNLTPTEILTQLKTVDGAASGLDADLLDGSEGSFYKNRYTYSIAKGKYLKIVAADNSHLIISGSMTLGSAALLCYYSVYGTGTSQRTRFKYIYYDSNYKVFVNNTSGKRELYIYNNSAEQLATINISALNTSIPSCEAVDTLPASYVEYNNSYALVSLSTLSKYLKLSGGTMTGSITLTSGGASAYDKTALSFTNADGSSEDARIGTSDTGHLGIYSKHTIYLKPDNQMNASTTTGITLSSTKFTYNNYNVLHSGNYTSYTPILNSSSTHATSASVIYAPSTAGTQGLVLTSNGSGAPIWSNSVGTANNGIFYIEGTGTTAGTWLGSHAGITSYYKGLTIAYKIPIAGASTTTLKINNLDAKTCYINTSKLTTHYGVGSVAILVYDGTYFRAADYWDGNNYAYVRQYITDSINTNYPLLFRYNTNTPETYVTLYTRYDSAITVNPSTNTITATTFNGTATLVSCNAGTDDINRPIVLTNTSNVLWYAPKATINYSTGNIIAPTFTGALKGNADTATSADKLSTVSKTAWGLTYWTSGGVPTSISGDMTGVGNITISATNNKDYFINFLYNSTPAYSWRLGYLGTGSGDTNYFVIQSSKAAGTSWNNAIRLGNETLDAAFGGNVYPLVNNTLTLGTSSLKWKNVYATTFTGDLSGNAVTATTANILKATTIISAKELSLSNTSWTDTGYTFASLTTGTYAVQVTSGTNLVASGIMSVYKNLSDTAGDEIPLHVYGTAGWRPYLRTYNNKLLISSNDATALPRKVTIKIALIL